MRRVVAALGALLVGGFLVVRPCRVVVDGTSMVPTLRPGDRLLALRRPAPRVGDLVVLPDPRNRGRLLVKRLAAGPGGWVAAGGAVLRAGPREVVVLGDNPVASTDSRALGAVRRAALRGRCVYRYGPRGREGWVTRGAGHPAA